MTKKELIEELEKLDCPDDVDIISPNGDVLNNIKLCLDKIVLIIIDARN